MRRLAFALLLAAAAARADEPGPTFGSPYAFTERGGAALYAAVCAGCHMPDGRGASGAGAYPALSNDPHLAASGYVIALVLRGRAAMPPFGRTLTDEQVAAVAGYIRTNFGNTYADGPDSDQVKAAR